MNTMDHMDSFCFLYCAIMVPGITSILIQSRIKVLEARFKNKLVGPSRARVDF